MPGCHLQDHVRRSTQVSSALERRLRQEGHSQAQALAQAQAQAQAVQQAMAEAQAAAHTQTQALLQERDDLQVRLPYALLTVPVLAQPSVSVKAHVHIFADCVSAGVTVLASSVQISSRSVSKAAWK